MEGSSTTFAYYLCRQQIQMVSLSRAHVPIHLALRFRGYRSTMVMILYNFITEVLRRMDLYLLEARKVYLKSYGDFNAIFERQWIMEISWK